MINYLTYKPTGWKKWHYVRTFFSNSNSGAVPFGRFPDSYLPAQKFWFQSPTIHCYITPPWSYFIDPYSAFLLGGGITGSILGSLSGMSIAMKVMEDPIEMELSIRSGLPITLGYCIGDLYKENVYFLYSVTRITGVGPAVLLTNMYADVFQRSKLKRVYVKHGIVRSFEKDAALDNSVNPPKKLSNLILDISGNLNDEIVNSSHSLLQDVKISIIKANNSVAQTISSNIYSVKGNWVFEIETPINGEPESGDFYILSKSLCIEDPLLISGGYLGKEGEFLSPQVVSGNEAHVTNYSSPYEEVKCVGAYVWKNNSGQVDVVSYTTEINVENDNGEWYWYYITGSASNIYGTDTIRKKEVANVSNVSSATVANETITITKVVDFKLANGEDVVASVALEEMDFVRIEISKGGSASMQNWHSPILKKCWIEQDGKYFAIINQPLGNVIDVSKKDVVNTTNFKIDNITPLKIFNQYAWIITEHHMNDVGTGIFGGKLKSTNYNTSNNTTGIEIILDIMSSGTTNSTNKIFNPSYLNGVNSFYNRYVLNPPEIISKNMVSLFKKNQNWRYIDAKNKSLSILAIDYSMVQTDNIVNLTVTGDATVSDLNESQTSGFVTFDEPYKRSGNWKNNGFLLYETKEGIDETNTKPQVCLEYDFLSSPIEINIPIGTIVGVCGGRFSGIGFHGLDFVNSENGLDMLVTTPYGVPFLSSFYDDIIQVDNLMYTDPYTQKATLRKGSLDFKDRPSKEEIVLGTGEIAFISQQSESGYELDQTKDRLKSISFKIKETNQDSVDFLLFGLKSKENYYGALVSGQGQVDLQALRKNDVYSSVSAEAYRFDNYYSSPVFAYNKSSSNYYEYETVAIGASTKDSPLYISSENDAQLPDEIKFEYVKENQTLELSSGYDIQYLPDGEYIIIYNDNIPAFKIDDVRFNDSSSSASSANVWSTPSGIFIIGTGAQSLRWECPLIKNPSTSILRETFPSISASDYKLPLLVLPDNEYLGSLINSYNQNILIFSRGYSLTDNKEYIACFGVPIYSLLNELKKCVLVNESKKRTDFLFRPVSLPLNQLVNPQKSYARPDQIGGLPSISEDVNGEIKTFDTYVRIIGTGATHSQITSGEVINVISPYIFEDGRIGVLYDSDAGIRMFYSQDSTFWKQSPIVIARNAHSPLVFCEELVAYITNDGIVVKIMQGINLYSAMALVAGSSSQTIEEIQGKFNAMKTILIGSGEIDSQRLTGYKTKFGVYKIFYYTKENVISCMESTNQIKWHIASNF